MGRLGRARTFIVEEMGAELKRPSDLGGVLTLRYEKRGYQKADVSVACNRIIDQMQSQGRWNGTSRDHDEPEPQGEGLQAADDA
jgi:predicted nucleotide-binding protein